MLAARLHGPRDIRLTDEHQPEPTTTEPLIRVTAVGLCGSDRHWYQEASIGESTIEQPVVLGHEFAGVIETGPRQGQRVAVDPTVACLRCEPCLAGNPNLCVHVRYPGHGTSDGALREYLTWPEHCLYEVQDSLSDEEAALVEPLAVSLHAIDLGHVRPGASVGVFGCGPVGLLLISLLDAAGASAVVATDPLVHRTAAADRLGAVALTTDGIGSPGEWDAATGARELDVAFEAAGSDAAIDAAIETVKPGGRIVLLGIPDRDRTSFRASVARRKGLTILISRRSKPIFERVMRLMESHSMDLSWLVTDRFSLNRVDEAFEALTARSGLKVMVNPTPQLN